MKKYFLAAIMLISVISFAGEPANVLMEEKPKPTPVPAPTPVTISPPPKEELAVIVPEPVDNKPTYTLAEVEAELVRFQGMIPRVIGEGIKKIVNNLDRWKGWSLSGHSWGGLSKDYNPWRVKVGIIPLGLPDMDRARIPFPRCWQSEYDFSRQQEAEFVAGFGISVRF